MKKLVKESLNEAYKEGDPFLDELCNAIENKLGESYAQNHDLQIDFDGPDDDTIDSLVVKEEYNVDFEDSEERHPWVEIETVVDFNTKTINTSGNLSSKQGDIDEDASRNSTFNENTNAEDLAEIIYSNHDEVAHDIEYAGEQQANRDDDDDEKGGEGYEGYWRGVSD